MTDFWTRTLAVGLAFVTIVTLVLAIQTEMSLRRLRKPATYHGLACGCDDCETYREEHGGEWNMGAKE